MLAALCRVVNELGCDILLLSGRPSRLPALTELLLRHLPVSPHRILPMHQYRVGSWYPFASSRGVVDDPKTTVVVGALICTLGNEMRLQDFSVDMRSFGAQSTARILGQMEADTIPDSAVIFDDTRAPDVTESDPVSWDARTFIGFRQVRYERWPATPLYCVSRARDADPKYTRMRPWYVTFRRPEQPDPDLPGARLGRPERLTILEVQGGEDRDRIPSEALECRLQTMTELDGYWLDTGFIDYTRGLADDA